MTKIKKSLLCVLSCLLVFCIGLSFTGCGDDKDKKYDVTIKVKNNLGQEWIFTPDIKELTYEFYYTGEEMTFYIDSYNLADRPGWGNEWITPDWSGANVFKQTMTYCPPGGLNKSYDGPVKEIGEYCISFEANSTSNLWNYRYVFLNVSII